MYPIHMLHISYGVASISRLLEIIGFFCRILTLLWGSFAKETHDFGSLLIVATPYHGAYIICTIIVHRKPKSARTRRRKRKSREREQPDSDGAMSRMHDSCHTYE